MKKELVLSLFDSVVCVDAFWTIERRGKKSTKHKKRSAYKDVVLYPDDVAASQVSGRQRRDVKLFVSPIVGLAGFDFSPIQRCQLPRLRLHHSIFCHILNRLCVCVCIAPSSDQRKKNKLKYCSIEKKKSLIDGITVGILSLTLRFLIGPPCWESQLGSRDPLLPNERLFSCHSGRREGKRVVGLLLFVLFGSDAVLINKSKLTRRNTRGLMSEVYWCNLSRRDPLFD